MASEKLRYISFGVGGEADWQVASANIGASMYNNVFSAVFYYDKSAGKWAMRPPLLLGELAVANAICRLRRSPILPRREAAVGAKCAGKNVAAFIAQSSSDQLDGQIRLRQ